METFYYSKIRLVFSIMLITLVLFPLSAADIYLSPQGNDEDTGTISAPYLSIQKAKSEVRRLLNEGLSEDITIYLRAGTYHLRETVVFGLEESPPSPFKLSIQSYQDEEVIISSAVTVQGWSKVASHPKQASGKARENLWTAPIPEGLTNFRVMYKNGVMLPRAKGEKWSPVPPPPESEVRLADSRNVYYNADRFRLRMVKYRDAELRDWKNPEDIEIVFNPVPWNMMIIPLESVDTVNKVGWLKYESNSQPGTKDPDHAPAFVYVENAIDFLDEPGEWCVNTVEGKIYYWPEDGNPGENISVPALVELFRIEGNVYADLPNDVPARNIHFKGLTLTGTDRASWYKNRKGWGIQHDWDTYDYSNAMMRFRGAEDCSVSECHFIQGGGSAIRLDLHAQRIIVQNNLIEHVGHMGILLCGYGPGTKDVNKHNTIHNNILHHTGELVWHGHAIFVWQSGNNEISHNWIHDVPRKAIGLCGVRSQILMKPDCDFDEASKTIRWNEIRATIDSSLSPQDRYFPYLHARFNHVRDNKVTRTMLKLADGSSINVSGAGEGNIIEHNFLYNLLYTGFRTDDWQDETYTRNNLVWNCGGSAYIFKGHNYLINNIAVNASKAVHLRAFPQQTFKTGAEIRNNIFVSDSEDFVVYKPAGWPAHMNIHKAGSRPMPYEWEVDSNVYFYPGAESFLAQQQKEGIEQHSVAADPEFINAREGDFRLKKKSPAIKLGFVPFDTNEKSFGITEHYPERLKMLDDAVSIRYEASLQENLHAR